MEKVYDVVVVGAGPVGLIYAYELSKDYSVALVDSNTIPSSSKSWTVPFAWLKDAGFAEYATNSIYKVKVESMKGNNRKSKGFYNLRAVNIDDQQFYKTLLEEFNQNEGSIYEKCKISSYKILDDFVELTSEKETIQGKLILDCSGVDSIFIKRGKNFAYEFYYNCYAKDYSNYKGEIDWTGVINLYSNEEGMVYINDVPLEKHRYIPWWFIVSENKIALDEMRLQFSEALESNYLKSMTEGLKPERELFGWIPIREIKSRSRNRILSLGDAGSIVPFQNGMSFSLALKTYKRFTTRIKSVLDNDKLDSKSLDDVTIFNEIEKLNLDLGKILLMFLKNVNPEEFEQMLELIKDSELEEFVTLYFYINANLKQVLKILQRYIEVYSLKGFLEILNRDGLSQEITIGSELFVDFVKRVF